uniref:ORF46 n=1 Tax=Malaco herpesvirus 1 TaxID=3031797 RepID=A0AA48P840_9VIRU|nr:TPA_asm: ORF46 [Malaco herpesvirus 1]
MSAFFCAVCLTDYEIDSQEMAKDAKTLFPCNHILCDDCYEKLTNDICPSCRGKLPMKKPKPARREEGGYGPGDLTYYPAEEQVAYGPIRPMRSVAAPEDVTEPDSVNNAIQTPLRDFMALFLVLTGNSEQPVLDDYQATRMMMAIKFMKQRVCQINLDHNTVSDAKNGAHDRFTRLKEESRCGICRGYIRRGRGKETNGHCFAKICGRCDNIRTCILGEGVGICPLRPN